jgi:hypothetical protein
MPGIPMSVEKFNDLLMNFARNSVATNNLGDNLETLKEFATRESGESLLERCLNSAMGWGENKVNKQILDDLSRVTFDWENFYTTRYGNVDIDPIMGVWMTESGVPVLGCLAGGDWECPINFVLYPDSETTLRAYLPTVAEGNIYNEKTNTAWGNEDWDDEQAVKEAEAMQDVSPNIDLFKAAIERYIAG